MSDEFKVGDRVRANKDCDNDFRDGEGIIKDMRSDGNIQIEVTKKSRYYVVGQITPFWYWTKYIELAKPSILKAPTHLVIWDEEDRDPCRFFGSESEAKDFIKELSEKLNVVKDSIILVEVKSAKKIKIQKSLTSTQHKI